MSLIDLLVPTSTHLKHSPTWLVLDWSTRTYFYTSKTLSHLTCPWLIYSYLLLHIYNTLPLDLSLIDLLVPTSTHLKHSPTWLVLDWSTRTYFYTFTTLSHLTCPWLTYSYLLLHIYNILPLDLSLIDLLVPTSTHLKHSPTWLVLDWPTSTHVKHSPTWLVLGWSTRTYFYTFTTFSHLTCPWLIYSYLLLHIYNILPLDLSLIDLLVPTSTHLQHSPTWLVLDWSTRTYFYTFTTFSHLTCTWLIYSYLLLHIYNTLPLDLSLIDLLVPTSTHLKHSPTWLVLDWSTRTYFYTFTTLSHLTCPWLTYSYLLLHIYNILPLDLSLTDVLVPTSTHLQHSPTWLVLGWSTRTYLLVICC